MKPEIQNQSLNHQVPFFIRAIAVLCIILVASCLTGSITQLDWPTQIKNGIVIDPRAFGAICNGNTSNATVDTNGIQAAMDAVQYANGGAGGSGAPYTGQVPTIVRLPTGQCTINAVLVVHKPNVIIEGAGVGADDNMKSGTWLNTLSSFSGPVIRTSSEDIYNYPSSGQGQNTPVVRGVQFRNFGIDVTAATTAGNFLSHWAIEAFSPSDNPDFINNIWVLGQRGGCFLISTSLSSSVNNSMYDPEQTAIRNIMCFTNGASPTGSGIQIVGSNEITIDTGSISIGNAGSATCSGTNDQGTPAGIDITSDSVGNFGNHINVRNIHVTDYCVHFRVSGADNDYVKFGQFGCATHPRCTAVSVGQTPQHYGPAWVHFSNNECESYHTCLVIRGEGNPNGYTNRVTLESTWDRSNTIYFPFASGSGQRVAFVDFMDGGEVDNGARASVYANQFPIVLGSNTVGITSWQYYDSGSVTSIAVVDSGGNNYVQLAIGRLAYVQLPRCFSSSCSIPSTDAPKGMMLYCIDCNAAAAGSAPSGGSSNGRMLVSNGASWVGM